MDEFNKLDCLVAKMRELDLVRVRMGDLEVERFAVQEYSDPLDEADDNAYTYERDIPTVPTDASVSTQDLYDQVFSGSKPTFKPSGD